MVGVGDPCCRICLSGRILPWPAVMGSGWGQCRATSLALPPTPRAGLTHSGELRALGPVRTRVLVSAERLSGACGPTAACTGRPCEQVDCGTQCPLAPCVLPRLTETAPLPLLLMQVCWPFLTVGSSCRGPCSPWCILVDSGGRAHAMSDMQPDPEWFFSRYQVLVHGRGRGLAGAMGRGRLMPNKQNLRVVECKPQPCVVSVEGLSSSTTDAQLKSLLTSVGPIQVGHPVPSVCALRLALPRLSSLKPLRRKLNVLPLCTLGTRTFCLRVRVFGVFQVLRNFMNCLFQLNKLSFEILKLSLNS